jgi:hypothetical protein
MHDPRSICLTIYFISPHMIQSFVHLTMNPTALGNRAEHRVTFYSLVDIEVGLEPEERIHTRTSKSSLMTQLPL